MFENKRNIALIAFFIAAVFCIPFYSTSMFSGLDLTFHLSRFDGMLSAMKDLQFPLAIYPEKNFGFGYASPLFYCDLFIFPAALLYSMNIPLVIVYKIFVFFISWSGACCTLYAMNEYTKKPLLCMFGTIVFTFSAYHINDFFIRAALGEAMAYSLLPLFMVIVKRFLVDRKNNILPLALFFSCLALCHLITFAFCAAVFALLLFCYLFTLFQKPKHFLSLLAAVVIGASLSLFFLAPLLQQMVSQKFLFVQNRELWGEEIMRTYSNTLISAFHDYIIVGHYDLELHHYFVGIPVVLCPLFLLACDRKSKTFPFLALLTLISILLFLLTTDLFPVWKIPYLTSVQFTYRFNILIASFLPFVMIAGMDRMSDHSAHIVLTLLMLYITANTGVIYHQLMTDENQISNTERADVLFSREFYENYNNYFNVSELSSGEYLPATHQMNYRAMQGSVELFDTTSHSISYSRTGTHSVLAMECEKDGFAALPVSWYLGYQAELNDNGEPAVLPISQEEYTGRIVIPVRQGTHTYHVYYRGTTVQKGSLLCSFICTLILTGYLLASKTGQESD
ncbi:MAG: hypothetical protein IKS32_12035 [Solobacterium sp.]|nr:hypothetical protein [Solobacterium sp.]